jgi:hypothetical protein
MTARLTPMALAPLTLALLAPPAGSGESVSASPGAAPVAAAAAPAVAQVVPVFVDDMVHFLETEPARYAGGGVTVAENGRVVERTVLVEPPASFDRIVARVTLRPVPKDDVSVHDPWDRAGCVRLEVPGAPDVEMVKFVTAYGGETAFEADVTALAPLLRGPCAFHGFVDTWLSPGWRMDFEIAFETGVEPVLDGTPPAPPEGAADWVLPLLYEESLTTERLADGPIAVAVTVPDGVKRVVLRYLVSGHCTDGTDDDEFVSKDNVVAVDGAEVERFRPWRDDCRRFRERNPYTRRWSDGWWSSDYSRSGWCPGDRVPPRLVDLSGVLGPGPHTLTFTIEDVRPKDAEGHFGYWRVSAALLGWSE